MDIDIRRYVSTLWTRVADAASKDAHRDLAQKVEALARDLKAIETGAIPSGVIVFWLGTAATIPSGWVEETTLSSRFPRGMASGGTPGATGGNSTHGHTVNGTISGPNASVNVASGSSYSVATGTHIHGKDLYTTNENNLPPYVDGIWIRKL